MRRFLRQIVLLCALTVVSGFVAVSASAAQSPVVTDCNTHGKLTRHYSDVQLRTALSTMPADVKEYSDCYDVVNRTLLAQVASPHDTGIGGSGKSGGGSFLPTPLIVVLVLLALSAATFGVIALRRRWTGDTPTGS
jgi:hypothetical protein